MTDDTSAPLVIDDDVMAPGFIAVPRVLWRDTGLTITARALFVTLLDYAWEAEHPCWPGYAALMSRLGWARASLAKYLRELQTSGHLSITRRGQGLTNVYVLHVRPTDVQKLNVTPRRSKTERPVVQKVNEELDREELDRVWRQTTEILRRYMSERNHQLTTQGARLRRLVKRKVRWTAIVDVSSDEQYRALTPMRRQMCRALSEASGQRVESCFFPHAI